MATLILPGCSATSGEPDTAHPNSRTEPNLAAGINDTIAAGGGIDGPWADEFKTAAEETRSDKARAILEDGVITAAERNEIHEDFRKCGLPLGIVDALFHPDGGQEIMFSQDLVSQDSAPDIQIEEHGRAEKYVEECGDETGVFLVEDLYLSAASNPDNSDTSEAVLSCLKREKIVADTYTLEEYKRDARTGTYPLIPIEDPFVLEHEDGGIIEYSADFFASTCESDPFGHLGLRNYDWANPWGP